MSVPKIIHQMWVGPPEPDQIRQWRQTVIDHHPGWDYWFITEPIVNLINQKLYDDAELIYPRSPWQLRADIVRYELLWAHGGVWVDADFEFRASLDPMMAVTGFAGWAVQDHVVNNALIGIVPRHPLMAEVIERLPASIHNKGAATVRTGPQFLTPIILRHPEIVIHNEVTFYPYRWDAPDTDTDTPFIHHYWNHRQGLYV